MESTKKYWKGLEEVKNTPEFVENNKNEFAEPVPVEQLLEGSGLNAPTPRRDFLKAMGFGLGAVLGLTNWLVPAMGAHGFWIGIIAGLSVAAVLLAIILKRTLLKLELQAG